MKLLKVPYYIKNERDSARTQRRIGGSAFESAAQLYYYHLQSACCDLPGFEERSRGYCPAGTAAVGSRNICNFPSLSPPPPTVKRKQLSPQTGLFSLQHPDWTGKVSRKLGALNFQEWLVSLKVPGWFESLKSEVKWSSSSVIVYFRFDTATFQCFQSQYIENVRNMSLYVQFMLYRYFLLNKYFNSVSSVISF